MKSKKLWIFILLYLDLDLFNTEVVNEFIFQPLSVERAKYDCTGEKIREKRAVLKLSGLKLSKNISVEELACFYRSGAIITSDCVIWFYINSSHTTNTVWVFIHFLLNFVEFYFLVFRKGD